MATAATCARIRGSAEESSRRAAATVPRAHVRGAAEVEQTVVLETLIHIHEAEVESSKWRTTACARVLGTVEKERTTASESCFHVRAVAEEEQTTASIRARAHGGAASRRSGGRWRRYAFTFVGHEAGETTCQREDYGIEIPYPC